MAAAATLLAVATPVPPPTAAVVGAASAPSVQGRVVIERLRDATDAVVWLEPLDRRPPPPRESTALLDQHGLDFVPHVLVVPVGTTVHFRNSDTVLHNIFAPGLGGEAFDLGTWPTGEHRNHRFMRPGVTTLLCNVHPEMEAFIVVVPTPWFARTSADGAFRIEGVPPGRYRLHAWHERCARVAREVRVSAGEGLELTLRMSLLAGPGQAY